MKKIILFVLLLQFYFISVAHADAIGTWKNYLSYYGVQQIAAAGDDIFVLSSNSLWQYNQNDQSIVTYDKATGLSDVTITLIAWNKSAKRLIAAYDNCNIDLVETDGDIINVSDIYAKTITIGNKTINSIYMYNKHAYLACGFGVVKMNVDDAEISESYMLGFDVAKVAISGNNIYAQAKSGQVWTAPLNTNLIDKNNWSTTTIYDSSIFKDDNSDYEKYYPIISTLNPGGPKYNTFGFMRFGNNKLYSCRGLMNGLNEPGYVQVLENGDWEFYEDEGIAEKTGQKFFNFYELDYDPTDITHVFVCAQNGLYEYRNGKFVEFYNSDNSPIESMDGSNYNYELVTSVKYDVSGNLWIQNSMAPTQSIIELTKDGKFVSYRVPALMKYNMGDGSLHSLPNLSRMFFDSRGYLWFVNNNWLFPSFYIYSTENNAINAYTSFVNQDGIKLENYYDMSCIVEDKNGDMWIGTDKGPFLFEKSNFDKTSEETVLTQIKVPRNDGTNYADYLLAGVEVTWIKIDNDNRKWIGTNGQGVYVISSDNMTEIHHFTTENSKLISDIIHMIEINEENGEVFIGTDKGLCSYMSGVTEPIDKMTKDNVYAYPNPVTSDFTGLITITGLTDNARVMILSSSGSLITQGRSNGRIFQWDGKDMDGKPVASGVYMVATATSNGEEGTVCKIAIIR